MIRQKQSQLLSSLFSEYMPHRDNSLYGSPDLHVAVAASNSVNEISISCSVPEAKFRCGPQKCTSGEMPFAYKSNKDVFCNRIHQGCLSSVMILDVRGMPAVIDSSSKKQQQQRPARDCCLLPTWYTEGHQACNASEQTVSISL